MRLGIILACADLPAAATTPAQTAPPAHTGPPAHTAAPAHTAPAGADRRAGELRAGELYVAPDADAAPGTRAAPLRTIRRAVDRPRPGDTILIRGGTHAPSVNIRILTDGTPAQPITMTAHPGGRVVIDGENLPHTPGAAGSGIPRIERGAIRSCGPPTAPASAPSDQPDPQHIKGK